MYTNGRQAKVEQCLTQHFNEIDSGELIDVQFILGETGSPKESERTAYPE
jgi:hypothetical protein